LSEKLVELIKNSIPRVSDLIPFEDTVFDYPLLYGITGSKIPGETKIEQALNKVARAEGGYFIDALWLAELSESATSDRTEYFMGDDRFRSFCVGLNEGANGWALLLGDDDSGSFKSLSEKLNSRKLRIFASGSAASRAESYSGDVKSLGGRETGLIYFAQMLMRYALIYGREHAGEAHEIAHAIEEYAPGVVFILGGLIDIEALLVQGMLSLGAPVITLSTNHGLVGHVYVSNSIPEMVEFAWSLPNIRARLVEPATPKVPVPTGRVFVREKLVKNDIALELKGSSSSFMVVKPSADVKEDEIIAQEPNGSADGFSVLVELGNEAVDPPITLWVEGVLRRLINLAKGVKVIAEGGGGVTLKMTREARKAGFTLRHLGNLVQTELRNDFPQIGPVRVSFITDSKEEARLHPRIQAYSNDRSKLIDETTEENLDFFYGCTRCRSFSLGHACTVTPDRPAQCSKPWYQLKANAVLNEGDVYDQCVLVEKGECLNPVRGEYLGVNESTEERTEGRVNRVYLHSIFGSPHTACSCFQNVVYHIPEVDGLAIMNRGFEGEAPGDMTWTKLGNLLAGRQYMGGAATIATAYLRSQKFLQADGGYKRVVWMSEFLKKAAGDAIPSELRESIATENDARTLEELETFLTEKGII
jgi:acetyl-CoA decarbonylase/synthase complex subunit beta